MLENRQLMTFDETVIQHIRQVLAEQHARLAQLDRPTSDRSITARNYDSAIRALVEYLDTQQISLPTKSTLERWRDDMHEGRVRGARSTHLSVKTINARLSAVRKLLRNTADDILDIQVKLVLRDWANVTDAKAIKVQDKIEEDYGIRLSLRDLESLINRVDIRTIKGLRDRALITVMACAGLRVSEAVNLTLRDVFLTQNAAGQRGIRIRRGKHSKARIVVLQSWNSPVLATVRAYIEALGLSVEVEPEAHVFRGVKRAKNGAYDSVPARLSVRGAERAVEAYDAPYRGELIRVNAHDLRRTFAKICRQSGMSWDALREQMGHSSVKITEDYVGHEVDWSERIPNWTIKLKDRED